jgi:hypothetical protein
MVTAALRQRAVVSRLGDRLHRAGQMQPDVKPRPSLMRAT